MRDGNAARLKHLALVIGTQLLCVAVGLWVCQGLVIGVAR